MKTHIKFFLIVASYLTVIFGYITLAVWLFNNDHKQLEILQHIIGCSLMISIPMAETDLKR